MRSKSKQRWPPAKSTSDPKLFPETFVAEPNFKTRIYGLLKNAITGMDIYGTTEETWLDEVQLAERLGVSRTPVRETLAMLEQQGYVKSIPRRGIIVLRKTRSEVIEMIHIWAAIESMAARMIIQNASDAEIGRLRKIFEKFHGDHAPDDYLSEYSDANLLFHQTLIDLTDSEIIQNMIEDIVLHVRGIRKITIGRDDRAKQSIQDHLAIIDALENREIPIAEKLCRDHTLGLADYVEKHGKGLFG